MYRVLPDTVQNVNGAEDRYNMLNRTLNCILYLAVYEKGLCQCFRKVFKGALYASMSVSHKVGDIQYTWFYLKILVTVVTNIE